MPVVECGGAGGDHVEELLRIHQVGVVAVGAAEMFAGQLQAQVPGVDAGTIAQAVLAVVLSFLFFAVAPGIDVDVTKC